jgi:hypothetical protein
MNSPDTSPALGLWVRRAEVVDELWDAYDTEAETPGIDTDGLTPELHDLVHSHGEALVAILDAAAEDANMIVNQVKTILHAWLQKSARDFRVLRGMTSHRYWRYNVPLASSTRPDEPILRVSFLLGDIGVSKDFQYRLSLQSIRSCKLTPGEQLAMRFNDARAASAFIDERIRKNVVVLHDGMLSQFITEDGALNVAGMLQDISQQLQRQGHANFSKAHTLLQRYRTIGA